MRMRISLANQRTNLTTRIFVKTRAIFGMLLVCTTIGITSILAIEMRKRRNWWCQDFLFLTWRPFAFSTGTGRTKLTTARTSSCLEVTIWAKLPGRKVTFGGGSLARSRELKISNSVFFFLMCQGCTRRCCLYNFPHRMSWKARNTSTTAPYIFRNLVSRWVSTRTSFGNQHKNRRILMSTTTKSWILLECIWRRSARGGRCLWITLFWKIPRTRGNFWRALAWGSSGNKVWKNMMRKSRGWSRTRGEGWSTTREMGILTPATVSETSCRWRAVPTWWYSTLRAPRSKKSGTWTHLSRRSTNSVGRCSTKCRATSQVKITRSW